MNGKWRLLGLTTPTCRSLIYLLEDAEQSTKTLLLSTLCYRIPLACTVKMGIFGSLAPDSTAILSPSLIFLSQFCFHFTCSFLPTATLAPGCPGLPSPQHAGTAPRSTEQTALSQESSMFLPPGNSFQPAGGKSESQIIFIFLSPLLNDFSLPAVVGGRLLNTPSPFLAGVLLYTSLHVAESRLPNLCHRARRCPRAVACGSWAAPWVRQSRGERRHKTHNMSSARITRQDSLSSLRRCVPTVKQRWEAIKMWNSPFPDRAWVSWVAARTVERFQQHEAQTMDLPL